MQIENKQLIDDLLERIDKSTALVQKFKEISIEKLNYKKYSIQWKWAFRYQWILSKI